ncbi:hypothetical protein GCM10011376_36130 [Nocardioides flavus (ex Wang et al. 2016)]|uniref:Integral membrane protein n=1 Tax=Nocardioides flavus (ex Wang et al. 2016) TaxID=2058780 RepID=A0ABQ3HMT8_9ACTN|nr:hypothetical protein [Nocardioides flavus (ex Wang et al. 2016)]GHE19003.1 hypothetical protein GCM10011376_36130 [Nocardioides flavus (ex Wang et al. 2016)]
MSTTVRTRTPRATGQHAGPATTARHVVGCLYLVTGGINAGLVIADPQVFRTFADTSFVPLVVRAWDGVVMAHPFAWIMGLACGEVVLGVLLLRGGPAARVGWSGVIAFHVLLMLFGFGFWMWSLPALLLLIPAVRADWPALAPSRATTSEEARP